MLTTNDIAKLSTVLATKEDLVDIKDRLTKVESSVNSLTCSVDGLAKKVETISLENMTIKKRLTLL